MIIYYVLLYISCMKMNNWYQYSGSMTGNKSFVLVCTTALGEKSFPAKRCNLGNGLNFLLCNKVNIFQSRWLDEFLRIMEMPLDLVCWFCFVSCVSYKLGLH